MRTVDLIPFILIELKDGDKYGIELSKNIESKFNGEIEIKQPTLYTVLKKLFGKIVTLVENAITIN